MNKNILSRNCRLRENLRQSGETVEIYSNMITLPATNTYSETTYVYPSAMSSTKKLILLGFWTVDDYVYNNSGNLFSIKLGYHDNLNLLTLCEYRDLPQHFMPDNAYGLSEYSNFTIRSATSVTSRIVTYYKLIDSYYADEGEE